MLAVSSHLTGISLRHLEGQETCHIRPQAKAGNRSGISMVLRSPAGCTPANLVNEILRRNLLLVADSKRLKGGPNPTLDKANPLLFGASPSFLNCTYIVCLGKHD